MAEKKRVYCLYRVSTGTQVDYQNHVPEIPMQRNECHRFVARFPEWSIVREFIEDGISGRKVSAKERDAIQEIRAAAVKKEFDILLVYMFDRLGRIANETPFVLEGLTKLGIDVWSVSEGQQRFENDVDHLINYIRFWKAESEANYISIRTADGMRTLVEGGHFKGGTPPYGFDLIKTGRKNKRGHEVYDLVINKLEGSVVNLIYTRFVTSGWGSTKIKDYLNEQGVKTKGGATWSANSIRYILKNKIYLGILRCADVESPVIPELIVVEKEIFDQAQKIFAIRSKKMNIDKEGTPRATKYNVLLNGLVYCGHCKYKLNITTGGTYNKRKDGTINKRPRVRYSCYGKRLKRTKCDGQTGYSASILDPIVDEIIKEIFVKTKDLPEKEIIGRATHKNHQVLTEQLKEKKKKVERESKELMLLKKEIIKTIDGSSPFSSDLLSEMINEKEKDYEIARKAVQDCEDKINEQQELSNQIQQEYDRLISWAEIYESADIETKKMIISFLIKRIEVSRGYEVNIIFKINLEQFDLGLELQEQETT